MLADLHNHTCLSPCGSPELTPKSLLESGAAAGIKLMAITDHNSSLNCPTFAKLSSKYDIIPIFGMEANTSEDIHILCLFSNLEKCMAFNEYAYSLLTPFLNNPDKTGEQDYVDEKDNLIGKVDYYLMNPLSISINNIGNKVNEYGGIVIPAHIDRSACSMMSQLEKIIDGPWAALECVHLPAVYNGAPMNTLNFPLITSSDAHYQEHVGRRSFNLNIKREELILSSNKGYSEVNLDVLVRALSKHSN